MRSVFLGVPAYGHGVALPTARTLLAAVASAPEHGIRLTYRDGCRSLLCCSFNELWAAALNTAESEGPVDWFVLLHADIGTADPLWLPRLLADAEEHGLDAIAAVACIKDASGDTSTALWRDGQIHRLSLRELRDWPEVATDEYARQAHNATLLINTGMLALRMGRAWNERHWWTIEDGLERGPDGRWRARVLSEDWRMSLQFAEWGIPYGVTRRISTTHSGVATWESEAPEVSDGNE